MNLRRRSLLPFAGLVLAAFLITAPAWSSPVGIGPVRAHAAATCANFPDQAAAQRAADTRDPTATVSTARTCPAHAPGPPLRRLRRRLPLPPPPGAVASTPPRSRTSPSRRPSTPTSAATSALPCAADGRAPWCSTAAAPPPAASACSSPTTSDGFDRDEYPPAVGRGKGKGLERGRQPRGWKADVAYVPSSENRSHGSVLGIKLRRFCDGTRFRYVFY